MADIMAKTIKFPGLNNTYEFMQPDGTYPDLTAGNIISNDAYTEDTEPYLFRALPYKSKRLEESLVGATVCWNQLVQTSDKSKSQTPSGLTTYDTINTMIPLQSGRVYFVIAEFVFNGSRTDARPYLQIGEGLYIKAGTQRFFGGSGAKMMFGGFGKPTTNTELIAGITTAGSAFSSSDEWGYSKLCVFDVTQMLGSVIADYLNSFLITTAQEAYDSMARFKLFAPKDDYEYDAGTLKSVNPTAHKMVGVNAWDEEWEQGGLSTVTGEPEGNLNAIRSKNFVPCVPSMDYWLTTQNPASYLWFYDANKNFMSFSTNVANRIFTTPSGCHYMKLRVGDASHQQTTYNHDICINISNTEVNGKYFPYEEHTYDLGNETLNGLFQLVNNKLKAYGDVRHAEGGTDREFALLDLGTLNYTLQSTGRFYATLPVLAKPTGNYNTKANLLCEKYDNITMNQLFAGTKGIATQSLQGTTVYVYDDAYSDAVTFKSAMSGVMLCYEKATTTTEDTPSFEKIQSCFPYGTEQYITTNDVPVGHETKYYTDVMSNIAGIPEPPSANGTYELKLTVTDGVASYSWVAV